jgi:hypothetical protein
MPAPVCPSSYLQMTSIATLVNPEYLNIVAQFNKSWEIENRWSQQ